MQSLGKIPEGLIAWENGWVEQGVGPQYIVVDEESMLGSSFTENLMKCLIGMATSMENALGSRGLPVTPVNVFKYLLHPSLDHFVDYTSQQLVSVGKKRTNMHEMYTFIATLMFRNGFNYDTDLSWAYMEKVSDGFELMPDTVSFSKI